MSNNVKAEKIIYVQLQATNLSQNNVLSRIIQKNPIRNSNLDSF
jgi:hypothetical protein